LIVRQKGAGPDQDATQHLDVTACSKSPKLVYNLLKTVASLGGLRARPLDPARGRLFPDLLTNPKSRRHRCFIIKTPILKLVPMPLGTSAEGMRHAPIP